MIGRLEGTVLLKNPPQILVDVQGVGYEIDVPMSTFYQLPETGMTVALLTHLAVREDGFFLYGFSTEAERHAFRQLIKIGGVGARTALAVLSGLSVDDLAAVVARQEGGRLTKIPGIGKKTAERLLFELKGKLPESQQSRLQPSNGIDDVVNALLALGYNAREAAAAVETLPEGISTADGIRSALKQLAKI